MATRSAPPRTPRRSTRQRPIPPPERRIRWLLVAAVLFLVICLGRAVQMQVVDGGWYSTRASGQHRVEIVTTAPRGAILDRDGYRLALTEQASTIGATTAMITDPARVVAAVAEASGESPDTIMQRLQTSGPAHVDLARQVPAAAAKRVQAMGIEGLDFTTEHRRVYPSAIAAPVIGVTDLESKGLAGLELQYDKILRGTDGLEVRSEDPAGNAINVISQQEMRPGHTISTGLDRQIQIEAESVTAETRTEYRAKAVTAIVMDPKTGEILAMASAPAPAEGDYRQATAAQVRLRAITDVYEPGSTFKAVTLGAGLATGRISPSTPVEVGSEWQLYDGILHDSHPDPGVKTATEALRMSSNIGVAKLAYEHLSTSGGHDSVLSQWIDRFGFGAPTGIDLPGEVAGIVPAYKDWSGTSPLNIPIGHGIATTPIQIAQLYATIANGGVQTAPHVVTRIDGQGPVGLQQERVMPARAANTLAGMLEGVVSDQGTGSAAQIPGYSVAGKTGTTKKIEKDGTYSDHRYLAWFVGFAPVKNPRILTLIMVDE
ncbi:MAG: penicillin-binding protein 2, partial [Actinobacteria bacterium]|nr:penicillin-binding protein 2 [Actinomycetota bacterium]